MWYICTVEYHSAIRKDEILPFVTARRELENIMLSEISQKKLKTLISLMWKIKLKLTVT